MFSKTRNTFSLLGEVRANPLIPFGFSLFWLWVWLVVQSSFLNSSILIIPGGGVFNWVVPLTAYGAVFFLLGVLYGTKRITPQSTSYKLCVGVLTSFGAATCALFSNFPTTNSNLTNLILVIGGILAGGGTACIHTEWGRLMSHFGPRKTIIHVTVGTLGAMVLTFLYSLLPIEIEWVILCLLPIACMTILVSQKRPPLEATHNSAKVALYLPWRLLITSFIQGAAFGILQTILLIVGSTQATMIVSVTGSLVGALLVFAVVFFFKLDFNQLIYHMGFVILAASFAIMAVAGSYFIGGWFINALGYRFIDILMWGLCVYLIKQRGLPTNWVFPVATCALILGQVFGSLTGAMVRTFFSDTGGGLEVLSVLMLFIILTAALFLANERNLEQGWGMIRPFESDRQVDNFAVSCSIIANDYELTPREVEIFILLARDVKRAQISKDLFLATETVKTHTRNIYRKMNVHSQEELSNLVKAYSDKRKAQP